MTEPFDDGEFEVVRRRGLRTGFTTGACATAASLAATRMLLSGMPVESVSIHLPVGIDASFELASAKAEDGRVRCVVIKDAGDDPDVTHGAEIAATVWWGVQRGVELLGGVGVGVVTRPGLGLELNRPAINPVPRRMILEAVRSEAGSVLGERGLVVEISVPKGEELARRTLNGRLGILGGLSILGTTGIVKPYSTASYRASVGQGIDVAAANGQSEVVLSTGGRSERFAQTALGLPEVAYVEMGEFTGHALKRCVHRRIQRVHLSGMIGKLSKVAQGHFMTHVAGNQVDPPFLAGLAAECGASAELQTLMTAANTARHAQELAQAAGLTGFFDQVARATAESCARYVEGTLAVDCLLFDFDGTLLGRGGVEAR
ncbi:MAG: cobalt-precorrin-5B (C(1))-methyltransferase [Dehalococcoidia bacterium]